MALTWNWFSCLAHVMALCAHVRGCCDTLLTWHAHAALCVRCCGLFCFFASRSGRAGAGARMRRIMVENVPGRDNCSPPCCPGSCPDSEVCNCQLSNWEEQPSDVHKDLHKLSPAPASPMTLLTTQMFAWL